jgi:hypothetical protein
MFIDQKIAKGGSMLARRLKQDWQLLIVISVLGPLLGWLIAGFAQML